MKNPTMNTCDRRSGRRPGYRHRSPARCFVAASAVAALAWADPAAAHFQELIPSTDLVTADSGPDVVLDLAFTHPAAHGPAMEMGRPVRFGVRVRGTEHDLGDTLGAVARDGRTAWRARYTVRGPGDHVFFVEPAPYWEPAEGVMIVHHAKVVVNAFGAEDSWDVPLGRPVEIAPLARPYGLWTGNVFRGIVLRDGRPAPFATVEVEHRNEAPPTLPAPTLPAETFETQVVKADGQGVFAYAMPKAGWWGFAALLDGTAPMRTPDGAEVPVELGALMWVRVVDMP